MSDEKTEIVQEYEDAKVLPPDYSLKRKIGNIDLDLIFTPKAIAEAQKVIDKSIPKLDDETGKEVKKLHELSNILFSDPSKWESVLKSIASSAFAIKTKAGLGGHELVATISKSLQLFCEQQNRAEISSKDKEIIIWHIDSITRLFDLEISGHGGKLGEEILAELEKIRK